MNEFLKATCIVILLFGAPTAAVVWADDRPTETTWVIRVVASCLSVGALALFLKLHFRHDKATDFLRRQVGGYFDRGGFCFAITPAVVDDVLHLQAWFQNRFERPCQGKIALRPERGFFMNRPDIAGIVFDIDCGPGAFGVTSLPQPVSRELQGKRQGFEVGASVEYPEGRGQQLRFANGVAIRENTEFVDTVGDLMTTAGLLTGTLILHKGARIKFALPVGVREEIEERPQPTVKTLWRLGDERSVANS